jgi:hypothetical protein
MLKDSFLLEQAYERIRIKESPDYVVDPNNKNGLYWDEKDALAFGFLSCVEKRTAKKWHQEKYSITLEGFPEEFKDKLYVGSQGQTHQQVFDAVVSEDIFNASQGTITLNSPSKKPIVFDLSSELDVEHEALLIKTLQEDQYNARELLFPAGRIWKQNKIISVWAKEGEVTVEHLDKLFNHLDIPTEEAGMFYIEFAGERMPSKKVHEYTSGGAAKKEYSEEEEKRAAEAMAKAHVAAAVGTKDTAVKKVISDRKKASLEARAEARAKGKIPDLRTRQLAQTSESLSTFAEFFEQRVE